MTDHVKTWVLLRGLSREHRHWEDFPQKLQNSFPTAKIICLDLPGNGDYVNLKSPLSINGMLQFVRNDIASLIPSGPVHIIGLSMGAMMAIEWMKSCPQECAAAVLMNTSLRGISPFYQRLRAENYLRILYTLLSSNLYKKEKMILQLTSSQHSQSQQLLQRWVSYAQQHPVSTVNTLRQLMAASRYSAPHKKPDIPMLLLRGMNDRLVNPQCSLSMAQNWQLPLETHTDAGHDLSLDDGDWVCEKINHWLDNH